MHAQQIEFQKKALLAGPPVLPVVRPCRIGDGILSLQEDEQDRLRLIAESSQEAIQFFIPASGSGSRMFSFLEEFIAHPSPERAEKAERFYSQLSDFAFFRKLPSTFQDAYFNGTLLIQDLIHYLLNPSGLNYGHLPKALIPFHVHEPFVLNAFQEHLAQGLELSKGSVQFHFTIQNEFQQAFIESKNELSALTRKDYNVAFSSQDKNTDAFVFNYNLELIQESEGVALRRPAGHGTLLDNLSGLQAPYILVKNIDNIQHFTQKQQSIDNWKFLLGLQIEIRRQLSTFLEKKDWSALCKWNESIGLFAPDTISNLSQKEWSELLNRPLRVCGMVRNNGQPGGGPFLMELNGHLTKQIVEKAQLTSHPQVSQLMLQSAYFNPVLMVLSPCDLKGQMHELDRFADPSSYSVVEKLFHGEKVQFIEQPGLWNGAMAKWNTLFVEVQSAVFSPVKSALDLLDFAHQTNKGA
jgi:hypothetical protein